MPPSHLSVDKVSLWLMSAGDIVAIIMVLEFPPKESFNNHVKTESL